MKLDDNKLDVCISALKQDLSKSQLALVHNKVYKFEDTYIIFNKSRKSMMIDCGHTIYSDNKYIFTAYYPKSVGVLKASIIDGETKITTSLIEMESGVHELPKALAFELSCSEYKIDNDDYLFSVPLIEFPDSISITQEGNNVKFIHKYELLRTIVNAKIVGNMILCNSWSSAINIMDKIIEKFETQESRAYVNMCNNMNISYKDIMYSIEYKKDKLDIQKLYILFDKIVKDIQSGKYNK